MLARAQNMLVRARFADYIFVNICRILEYENYELACACTSSEKNYELVCKINELVMSSHAKSTSLFVLA